MISIVLRFCTMDSNKSDKSVPPKLSRLDASSDSKKRKADLENAREGSTTPVGGKNRPRSSTKRTKQDEITPGTPPPQSGQSFNSCDEVVRSFVKLEPLSGKGTKLSNLTAQEKLELEAALGIGEEGVTWRDDWAGCLAFVDEEILNPDLKGRKKQSFRQSLLLWAGNNNNTRRLLHNLVRFVANMKSTPPEAKRILSYANSSSVEDLEQAIRRTSFDPVVLEQDGWTCEKAEQPEGASGGAYWIGEMIRWQNSDAVVLAFVYDPEIGDLWKVAWVEEGELTTFDLEAEELREARKKWLRRQAGSSKTQPDSGPRKSSRFLSSENFSVEGVEEGIVLAASFSRNARQGVYWPARIVHPSENRGNLSQSKRSSFKQKMDLVFLAPYWDSDNIYGRNRKVEGLSESGPSAFHGGALFQVETADASFETILPYPFDPEKGVDIDQVKNSFRFTGLPKLAFERFLDSHRLALALKLFARKHAKRSDSPADMATAGLFETHPLALRAPIFPSVVLHLPFPFILSQLPQASSYDSGISSTETVLRLSGIVEAMKPPNCWGLYDADLPGTPERSIQVNSSTNLTPSLKLFEDSSARAGAADRVLQAILHGLPNLTQLFSKDPIEPGAKSLVQNISDYVRALEASSVNGEGEKCEDLSGLVKRWASMRSVGEDSLYVQHKEKSKALLQEWRVAAERMYRRFLKLVGHEDQTLVITDFRCNGHITNGAAFERCVRLPAALKGARLAGLGSAKNMKLIDSVTEECVEFVESALLMRAHDSKYLEKIKNRCNAVQSSDEVILLTEDSDGNGGEDTRGSRGTWKAAICGVAAAVTAVDKVVAGEFVNAFCATRPPGHHAGRKLHPMKAVSNGFCVLNPAACAAIHATTQISDGGPGLSRVCVIDFDVHHGNGTQDILCSTYDPRFLYISIHAGGSLVNGISVDEDLNGLVPHANKSGGIYRKYFFPRWRGKEAGLSQPFSSCF